MNGVLAVSALAVFAAVCGALIKKGNPEIALLFSIGAAVLVSSTYNLLYQTIEKG